MWRFSIWFQNCYTPSFLMTANLKKTDTEFKNTLKKQYGKTLPKRTMDMVIPRIPKRKYWPYTENIHKSEWLTSYLLTSSHSSSSLGVSNQSISTLLGLIRHAYRWGDKKWEKTIKSSVCSHWMDSRVTSTQPTVRLWCNWRFQKLVRNIYPNGYRESLVSLE